MAIASIASFVEVLRQLPLLDQDRVDELARDPQFQDLDLRAAAKELVRRGWLTVYQVNQVLQGGGADLVLGSYVVLERLGEGGMGTVFKARHQLLDRVVAVKVIRAERLDHPDAVRRFQREVRAAAQLSHPNVVHAFDADQVGDTHLLVMEYVEGRDLARVVRETGRIPVLQACDYIRQAALGLQHAHEHGLVHRDIKPHNLLRMEKDLESAIRKPEFAVVKVLDMGVARQHLEDGESSSSVTKTGCVVGTPDFIAPEQARDAHAADIRSDLYSLGCTLYFMLTGQVPFPRGSATEKLLHHVMDEPVPVEQLRPEVSSAIAAILRKMMAKRPKDRYQTPAELAAALATAIEVRHNVEEDRVITAKLQQTTDRPNPSSTYQVQSFTAEVLAHPQELRRPAKPRRWLLFLVGGGGFVVLSISVFAALLFQRTSPEPIAQTPVQVTAKKFDIQALALREWSATVRQLPAEKQVEAVKSKLKELNPRFDGTATSKVEQGVVTELQFVTDAVTDLSPVRALPGLKSLTCAGSAAGKGQLADLSPLAGLSLTSLNCNATRVADLAPLKKMPLTRLHCSETQVTDLTPLRGMPLTRLGCRATGVKDLSPLQGMKLTSLQCDHTRVASLAPLQGMPLGSLECGNTTIGDLKPLEGMKLTRLVFPDTKVKDLSPLHGMKLTWLDCQGTPINSLAPLQKMPLQTLRIGFTHVAKLTPLQDSPLQSLDLRGTPVDDLKPLAKLPLRGLDVRGTKVEDLTPLKTVSLKAIACDVKPQHVAVLRAITTLEQINDRPVKEFWKMVPSK